jgi:SAM-dependent MidA family methyltransferase
MSLPAPDPAAAEHSERLRRHIAAAIDNAGGWLSFARYMELALYAPGLGYYGGGARKFGAAGDFVTAPELSPLFARALAAPVAQVMGASAPALLEAGAGSGALAAELLLELAGRGAVPDSYFILELSGELRERQQQTLAQRAPALAERVRWLDRWPETFSGAVIANELLDAMPVHVVAWREAGIFERGVARDAEGKFAWAEQPAQGALLAAAQALPVEAPFVSEINLAARAWTAQWARILEAGALLLIDYGFPQREYYHPQRNSGTLMCHYRHHAHEDPFWLPGLNDITAHVDFSALAEAAHDAGLALLGYTSQAAFLLDCGLTELLAQAGPEDAARYLPLASGVQKLISPSEMGELFKAIALGRGMAGPLIGFRRGERSHSL